MYHFSHKSISFLWMWIVESLFTNVPVIPSIDIILEIAHNHPTIAPPAITFDQIRKLLIICTTKTPFSFDNQTYIQTNGVSMGSPLGPTLADFYMENLEGNLLRQDRASNPKFYKRYVDDILAIFHKESHVNIFKQRLHRSSVLNFTHEEMTGNTFNFLDLSLNLNPTNLPAVDFSALSL